MSSGKFSAGKIWAVILAGGSGTRFWPESRARNPKQFLSIFGKKTLLEETLFRLHPVIPKSRVIVITHQLDVTRVAKLLKIPTSQVIGEPVGRNTAPCAALAAKMIYKKDPNAVIAILPSDHRIGKPVIFRQVLVAAAAVSSETDLPVTFGIEPASPHTGYGYLEKGGLFKKQGRLPIYRLKRFHEKPQLQKAKAFLRSGKFLWNSGMFVWSAKGILDQTAKYLPEVAVLADKIIKGRFESQMKEIYPRMPNISIDYGLMEKMTGRIFTIPADMDWHDLGGWLALPGIYGQDIYENTTIGKAVYIESKRNIVRSGKRLVALLGVEDVVVVDTEDALLVCSKSQTESVRKVVQYLKDNQMERHL